jgi:cell division protein FtsB
MLGRRKKKTSVQMMRDITENISSRAISIKKSNLPLRAVGIICIFIFSLSICYEIYGFVSTLAVVSKRERNVEKLEKELQDLKEQLVKKQELREKLINDPFTIEAVARSYGMSRKGERVFYFLD